ncbi:DUF421 domain-containing protein [Sphingomonas solaris]|uniref:DUF421 domain-containing protein n=1 Tax=Alterirhizorhabdus solaris TaxID=2529389 RepID=A0A558RDS8_9SPHN|nr:YetF domain-containing protein [Sphingomonas solaris]TVV77342.1 DUF421 domain-containing protein [Sphingomonas solaris]
MITGSLYGLLRIIVVGPLAYLILIAILRVSGKRTLAKLNAFDFVVTVALGSTLATVLLSKDVPLLEGVLGFSVLAILQFIIAWVAQRAKPVEAAIKAEPRILLLDGRVDQAALLDERVTEDEIRSAVRKGGLGTLDRVAAVVLETDGSFSVIPADTAGDRSALPGDRRGNTPDPR